MRAAEQDRPDVAERRAAFRVWQAGFDVDRLVFLDETWAKTNMTRLWGRARKGERLVTAVPHGHWKTTTFLAGLRSTGLVAPLVLDGAINGALFLAYVRQQLAPTLSKGDVVIMDNLSPHKGAPALALIAQAGAQVRFLPAYSPDLNPIEPMWSKVKTGLRTAEARTQASLGAAIAASLETITSQDARNWFGHCGYSFI